MKGAEKVFSFGSIYSCFASYGRVDLRDDGGRNLDDGNSSVVDGGDKAC